MMMNRLATLTLFPLLLSLLTACNQEAADETPELVELPSGLQYLHLVNHKDKPAASLNDYLEIEMRILTEGGADTLYDNFGVGLMYPKVELPAYQGAPEEALLFLHEGDSIHLFVEADKKYQHEKRPEGVEIKPGSRIEYQIKVKKIMAAKEYFRFRLSQEEQQIQDFLKKQKEEGGLEYEKHPSGLYYRYEAKIGEPARSQSAPARPGDEVTMDYIGRFMGGIIFDRTASPTATEAKRKAKPISFVLGKQRVIPAWEIAVSELLHEREQIELVVPSKLAFGDKGNPGISVSPFSPLRFTIRLQEIKRQGK